MTVNIDKIQNDILSGDLKGDPQTGLLKTFGVILAINSVEYLVNREMEYIKVFPKAEHMVEKSLIDAAQWCCNATFGGFMDSQQWKDLIEPMIENEKDRMDALMAVTNCLGWGRLDSYELDEQNKKMKMIVRNSYYLNSFQDHKSDKPRCYMWNGVAAGYMDLLFGKKVHSFEAKEVKCVCKGDEYCEFHVQPVQELLDLL